MKRLLFYIGSITFAIVIAFTSIGLVHYIDNENSKQTIDVASSSSSELFNLQQEINNLFLKKDEFLQEKEDLLSELSVAQGSSQTYVQAIADLEDEIETLYVQKLEYESDKQDIEDLLDELDETDEEQAGQIATLQGQIVSINSSISSIETQITSLQTQITSLQTSNSSILTQITDLTTRISLVETSISTLETRISAVEENITTIYGRLNSMNKNIITGYLASDWDSNADNSINSLTLTTCLVVGNKLSISNGKIIIGDGVSKVLVSASITFKDNVNTAKTAYGHIYRNDTQVSNCRVYCPAGNSVQLVATPSLVAVSSGNNITLRFQGPSCKVYSTYQFNYRTYITVEVVE